MLNRPPEDREPVPDHPEIRRPFPLTPLLIVVSGVLFFLLCLSAGYNVWLWSNPDHPLRRVEEMRRNAEVALQQQTMAQQQAQTRAMQQDFQQKLADLQRKNEQLTQQLEAVKEQADDAKRGPAKEQ